MTIHVNMTPTYHFITW